MIKNISIILVDVQLPENIGLTARAMFNFGISNLILVNPKIDLPSEKAEAVAVDAVDLVKNAKIYDEFVLALSEVNNRMKEIETPKVSKLKLPKLKKLDG